MILARLQKYVRVFAEAEILTVDDLAFLMKSPDELKTLLPRHVPRERFKRAYRTVILGEE